MTDLAEHRRRLLTAMDRRGDWPAGAPWVREAVTALPRDLFAPDVVWRWDGHAYRRVHRHAEADCWAAEVYAGPDDATVTQVTEGLPTSSLSCQAVVVDMLDSLDLRPGHLVLELGTGTGWNAALLARRAGRHRVTSLEIDQGLAKSALERLESVGAGVAVELADGAAGWPLGAPFDRVVSTYAVERVPWSWIAQTRPGGVVAAPWGRLGHVALTVAEDGRSASGRVRGLGQFMPARDAGRALEWWQVRGGGPAAAERPLVRDLTPLRADPRLVFALRVALPDVLVATAEDADGVNAWLHDGRSSWAALSTQAGGRSFAHQGGPRRLADEVERAWDEWLASGSPAPGDHVMTVREDGQEVRVVRAAPA